MILGDLLSAEFDKDCHCGIPVVPVTEDMCMECTELECRLIPRVHCMLKSKSGPVPMKKPLVKQVVKIGVWY